MCLLMRLLLYYVSLPLSCSCAYLCIMIVGGGRCHFGGMCIGYMLGICLI